MELEEFLFQLIKKYLHNRIQLVNVKIYESDKITNDIGVPQGSILDFYYSLFMSMIYHYI